MPAKKNRSSASVYVGRSPIHGRGVFAARTIPRGTLIATFEGERTTRNGTHVLWLEGEDGSLHGLRGTNELRYLNHAKRANAALEGVELWSLRRIAKDEEITIDYGEDWD